MIIQADQMHFQQLNESIRAAKDKEVVVENCMGQRYIGSGLSQKEITIHGIPGNALGSYLDGASIVVKGNAQDAIGDTMNEGLIAIHGSCGDATGYGMRGGRIYVKGNAGYRAGIHMKAYHQKLPVLVIGGNAGSFLGEYQAGGIIIVLGMDGKEPVPVGRFCGTGMHGGAIYIRSSQLPWDLPKQINAKKAQQEDFEKIDFYLKEFCDIFDYDKEELIKGDFYVLTPNTKTPYKQLYTHN